MPASISSKTIVSPPPTAAIASAIRESSPPDAVSATGPNGRPGFGRIRNRDVVRARDARLALGQLRDELALAEADAFELARDRLSERLRGFAPRLRKLVGERAHLRLRRRAGLRGGLHRVGAVGERLELGARLCRAREQLLERRAAEPALRLGDPVEVGLDLLDAVRLGLERGEKRPELARGFAQPMLGVAQIGRRIAKLRRKVLERRQ